MSAKYRKGKEFPLESLSRRHTLPLLSVGKLDRIRLLLLSKTHANMNITIPNKTPIIAQQISVTLRPSSKVNLDITWNRKLLKLSYFALIYGFLVLVVHSLIRFLNKIYSILYNFKDLYCIFEVIQSTSVI